MTDAEKTVDKIAAAGGRTNAFAADVGDEQEVEQLMKDTVSRYGTIDILVANAGTTATLRSTIELPTEEWEATMRTNCTGIFYSVKDKNFFKNKKVCIFGGGDSALDWAIELSKISEVILVHRRNEFRGVEHSASVARKLEKEGKLKIKTPFQINSIEGENKISAITIKSEDGKTEKITTDCVLGFFGLIMKLGPIAEWGLNLEKKTIPVNTENFQTNKKGIFAIGDICSYPGKLKLILSGFHEGALAARACFKLSKPNETYRFEYTTTSKSIRERLGVKKSD
mgnify:CR=1 FL=1